MPAMLYRLLRPKFVLAQVAAQMVVVVANQVFVIVKLATVIVVPVMRLAAQPTAVRTSRLLQSLPQLRNAARAAAKRSSRSLRTNFGH